MDQRGAGSLYHPETSAPYHSGQAGVPLMETSGIYQLEPGFLDAARPAAPQRTAVHQPGPTDPLQPARLSTVRTDVGRTAASVKHEAIAGR